MKKEATKDTLKPPLGLQPRWSHEGHRLLEILDAAGRYATAGVLVSPDWLLELQSLATSPHIRVDDLEEAYSKIAELWAVPFMMEQEWPKAFESLRARLMAHRGVQVCTKCRGEGHVCVSCLRPVDAPGCEDLGGELAHPDSSNCVGCGGRGIVIHE